MWRLPPLASHQPPLAFPPDSREAGTRHRPELVKKRNSMNPCRTGEEQRPNRATAESSWRGMEKGRINSEEGPGIEGGGRGWYSTGHSVLKGQCSQAPLSLPGECTPAQAPCRELFCSRSENYKGLPCNYALPHQCHSKKPVPQTEPRCAVRPQDKVSSCHIISKSRGLTASKCPSIGDA